ncbi:sensor histidine kinase [Vulgatibacter sp.]|uniref:sensor histidine kinase n=1 Tax=Vulgatibacter sp. TaxID=1971226 RepID=UPI0035631DFC
MTESKSGALAGFGRQILDGLDVMVVVVGLEGGVLEVNRAVERATGLARGALLGRRVWEVVEELSRNPPQARSGADFAAMTYPWYREHEIRGADGSLRTIRWCTDAVRDEAGAVLFYVATGEDVTEARAARAALEEQLRLQQTLIDTIPAPIFYKGTDGRYLGCNEAFLQMLGKRREEIVGRTTAATSPSALASEYDARDRALFENPGVQRYEWQVRWADGSVRDVLFSKATWTTGEGAVQGLVGVILDITERKRSEQALEARVRERTAELAAAKEAAESADRAKSEFLNIASHELRTPLTALRVALQRGRREIEDGRPVSGELLARMERYLGRLVRLASDLLEASRLERGQLLIHPAPVQLERLLTSVVEDYAALAPGRAIDLALGDSPAVVLGDADRLAQTFANLLDNALKYAPPEAPIEIAAERAAGGVQICVSDRGPGIPPEGEPQLFTRFFRLPASTHLPGLGLGLNIAREIVELHGGTLRYEARPGGGSRFLVWLPTGDQAMAL